MDQTAFYGVVATLNFTLLGLWWVAIKDRHDLGRDDPRARQMAYLVSLQFLIPAAVSLIAQVAPDKPAVWRFGFTVAGVIGAAGALMLARQFRDLTDAVVLPWVFAVVGVPLYLVTAVVALAPSVLGGLDLRPIEVEGLLLSVLVVLGVNEAWFVTMTPRRSVAAESDGVESA